VSKLKGKNGTIIKSCLIKPACVPNTTDLVLTVETHVNEISVEIYLRWPNHDYYYFYLVGRPTLNVPVTILSGASAPDYEIWPVIKYS
jgi:hypothetical protein